MLYSNYLDYLHDFFKNNRGIRGLHAQISKAAGIHPSYLSRVLHGSIHLTPDQAAGFCAYWSFTEDETNYFLNLVNFSRAGTPALKKIISRELQTIRSRFDELGNKLPAEKMAPQSESIYYSSWYYAAVHILTTLPLYQTENSISEKLRLPRQKIKSILETLKEIGLVQKTQNRWIPTKTNIHLSNESWQSVIHHTQWRIKMAEEIQLKNPEHLHYTGVHTLSLSDFKKIKSILNESIVNIDKIIRPSKEEALCCLLIDWTFFE